jgi:hypothetical protein
LGQIVEFFGVALAAQTPMRSALIALLWLYPLFGLNCLGLAIVWLRARRHFRETYALGSLFATVIASMLLVVTIFSGIVPWEIQVPVIALFTNATVTSPAFDVRNFVIWALLYVVFLFAPQS